LLLFLVTTSISPSTLQDGSCMPSPRLRRVDTPLILHASSFKLSFWQQIISRAPYNRRKSLWSLPSSKLTNSWTSSDITTPISFYCYFYTQLWWILTISGGGIRSACVSKFWGWLHPMQCRYVFNIGRPRVTHSWRSCAGYVFFEYSCLG
jgi:hypothetical protein